MLTSLVVSHHKRPGCASLEPADNSHCTEARATCESSSIPIGDPPVPSLDVCASALHFPNPTHCLVVALNGGTNDEASSWLIPPVILFRKRSLLSIFVLPAPPNYASTRQMPLEARGQVDWNYVRNATKLEENANVGLVVRLMDNLEKIDLLATRCT